MRAGLPIWGRLHGLFSMGREARCLQPNCGAGDKIMLQLTLNTETVLKLSQNQHYSVGVVR